jgi:hypothetical protein
MNIYGVIKEILQYAITWMKLQGITLSEICYSQRDKYDIFPCRAVKIIGTERRIIIALICGEGEMRSAIE